MVFPSWTSLSFIIRIVACIQNRGGGVRSAASNALRLLADRDTRKASSCRNASACNVIRIQNVKNNSKKGSFRYAYHHEKSSLSHPTVMFSSLNGFEYCGVPTLMQVMQCRGKIVKGGVSSRMTPSTHFTSTPARPDTPDLHEGLSPRAGERPLGEEPTEALRMAIEVRSIPI